MNCVFSLRVVHVFIVQSVAASETVFILCFGHHRFPSHPYILRVRGASSSHGAMYPNHISTLAYPQDSWGIFTAQLKHDLDGSSVAHPRKPPHFHQDATLTPPDNTDAHSLPRLPHTQTQMSGWRSAQLLIETSRSSFPFVQLSLVSFYNISMFFFLEKQKSKATLLLCPQYFIRP